MTNMIVTTENGIYTFILKENPFGRGTYAWPSQNPYRNVKVKIPHLGVDGLLRQASRRVSVSPLDIRNPNSSDYIYDPVSQTGCKGRLKAHCVLPRRKQAHSLAAHH